ncbi:MAG: diaminopimelate decarboxylase [Syntrophomonadaceae bacterium]|jgi:diaminopimelate decarboxylase|nr:diaminopimelate decarboxylase [Syntrophomonadaceae bacterium]
MYLTGTMKVNKDGHLEIGGKDCVDLVKEFGTPLWVIDEEGFRQNCRGLKEAFAARGDSRVLYASKTLLNPAIIKIVEAEGLGLDVVSGGELYTARHYGFPMERVFFHGNNKSRQELEMALEFATGNIVVDNFFELSLLEEICANGDIKRKPGIFLRITPGVEAHTHEFMMTGQIDSKFGFTLPDGQAMEGVKAALQCSHLQLAGLHCHIGSQIFSLDSFEHTSRLLMDFIAAIKKETGYEIKELDMGGGWGIFYYEGDKPASYENWADSIWTAVHEKARALNLNTPRVTVEPGRAIAGPAGITLYTVGSRKEVKGIRKYIAVDGGMTDNPRPALYGSKYTALLANKADRPGTEKVSVAGKCCESGDMLIWDAELPAPEAGDILAVFATGAYNYTMSSNYNRLLKPAMVLVKDGIGDLILRRETFQDLLRNELLPDRLK